MKYVLASKHAIVSKMEGFFSLHLRTAMYLTQRRKLRQPLLMVLNTNWHQLNKSLYCLTDASCPFTRIR